ncbi:ankyrin repeat-containing [Diplodia corticola]|uniref:Ankyrin repeat-containing n=1 Tax=Diplodia corticola TaxID=236234 RepID=A0A1J9RBU6_9PEZI|nr:ankyrin repeat-containing [Diplodia corticola]OJD39062.1 ankyrin repeat-containing [Diplodia corticola]
MDKQVEGDAKSPSFVPAPAEKEAAALQEYRDAFIERVAKLRETQEYQKMDLWALPREWSADQKLLQPVNVDDVATEENAGHLCANISLCEFYPRHLSQHPTQGIIGLIADHPGYLAWREERNNAFEQCHWDRLSTLQARCMSARLRECKAKRCLAARKLLASHMPSCEDWAEFREWVLTAASCQSAAWAAGDSWLYHFDANEFLAHFHSVMITFQQGLEDRWFWLHKLSRPSRKADGPDLLFQVQQVIFFWASQLQPRIVRDLGHRMLRRGATALTVKTTPLKQSLFSQVVMDAEERAAKLSLCPKRLWSVVQSLEWLDNVLPALVDVLEKAPRPQAFAHRGHEECSAQFCELSLENSALKKQLHKRDSGQCGRTTKLHLARLSYAVRNGETTAWPIEELQGRKPERSLKSYMAISHVWSDGTGVGTGGPGVVNECLLSYFIDVATRLGCDGIWWDAISIPMEKEVRRMALNRMQPNYEKAKHTVVHDEYLLQVDWAEDGSPAVALILSPWFTRGWTALELSVSRSVQVIYRDPTDPKKQVLKDLDNDILPQGFCSIGHRFAADMIRNLRGKPPTLAGLVKILSTRSTSWTRDRATIAALLARTEDFDYSDAQSVTVRKMVVTYRQVPRDFLLHGHITLAREGGCSWLPSTVISHEQPCDDEDGDRKDREVIEVDRKGAACVRWSYYPIPERRVPFVKPYSSHASVELRIQRALQMAESCFLLWAPGQWSDNPLYVLVRAAGLGSMEDGSICIDSHYVGCVKVASNDYTEMGMIGLLPFRVGCAAGKAQQKAEDVLRAYKERGGLLDLKE